MFRTGLIPIDCAWLKSFPIPSRRKAGPTLDRGIRPATPQRLPVLSSRLIRTNPVCRQTSYKPNNMIRAEKLTKIHRRGETDVAALRGVDFEIADESFAFIVGPSGSGKSTILHLLGALDDASSGRVIVDGKCLSECSVRERDEYRRNQVGFIFQNFNLLANMTAVDNVLVPFLPQGVPDSLRAEAVELLKSVGLENRLAHRPNQLSGGEQQRVAIARALLKKPGYILADEPTGELDSATGQEIFGYLRDLHIARGTTIVVVTHDQSLVTDQDVVIRLRDGQLAS